MKSRFFRGLLAAVSFALLVPVVGFAASLASDKASDPAYSGGWTNGSNGGVGWSNTWTLIINTNPTNTPTSHFISSSTGNNTNGDTNADGDIDTAGVAFGMLSFTQEVDAVRTFDGTLTNGQKFVILMDNGVVASGQTGFYLQNSGGETRFQFLLGTNGVYDIQGVGPASGVTNTVEGLRVEVEIVDLETSIANIFVTKLEDGTSYIFSNKTLNTSVATPEIVYVSLVNDKAGGDATNQVFFNSMAILPDPADTNFFADLSVTKSASADPALVGSNVTYTITITNNGPATATAVTVTDAPPASLTFVSAVPSQGNCTTDALGQVICDLGLLASNDTASVTLVGTPSAAGIFTNIATVFALNVDPNTADNEVTNIITVLPAAQLSISPSSLDFGTIVTGTTAQATFVVTNSGGSTLTGTASVAGVDFAIASGSPFSVAASGSTNVDVNFTPTSEGDFSNDVIFATNGGDSTNAVTGSGAIVPSASFTGTPTAGLHPLTVTYSDTSTGTITNRFWNFGDGGTTNTTSTNVVYQYAATGTNTVSLIVTGPLGVSTNTQTAYIIVTNIPPQLAVTPTSHDFGTLAVGEVSTQDFTVVNEGLDTLSGTATVSGDSEFALLSGSPYNIAGGQTDVVSVTFSPASAGSFAGNVVFASNGGDATNALTGAGAVAPTASFTGSPTNGAASLLVNFTDASSGTITNRSWTFGDSGTSTASSPSHTYTSAGTFSVGLTVFGPLGSNTLTRSNYITVTNAPVAAPVAGFTASPTNGTAPLIVSFTDASTGSITNRLWTFGDGDISTSANPTHVYTNADDFTVSLTVYGPGGSNTVSALVSVTGIAKNSPVGDWEVTVKGADKGTAFLTVSNNATATGYGIRLGTFGLDTLSGTWDLDAKGNLTGSFIEQLGGATNWTGTLAGKAKTDQKLSASITTSNGVFKWKGVPATTFPDLSGMWTGTVSVAKTATGVEYAITTNATNSGVFDVATSAATNTVIGQFIETSRGAITGYIMIDSNQTTLSGKFKESKSSISLKGSNADGKVKVNLIKE